MVKITQNMVTVLLKRTQAFKRKTDNGLTCMPPPQVLRSQSQAGELEAQETGDEKARSRGRRQKRCETPALFLSSSLSPLRAYQSHSERETSGNETDVLPFAGTTTGSKFDRLNTWCMGQLVYIKNCIKSPIAKNIV